MTDSTADIIVAGHICLDIIPTFSDDQTRLDELIVPGKLVSIGPAVAAMGGPVSNTGLSLHRLGVPVSLMGKVGDDALGHAMLDILSGHGESLAAGMLVIAGEHSSYTLVMNPPGVDRCFLHCSGANDTFAADDVPYDRLAGAKIFHFGYPPLMRRMFAEGGGPLRSVFSQVRAAGVATSLDMAMPDPQSEAGRLDWKAWLAEVLPEVDIFLPSAEEILFMIRRQRFDAATASGAADLASHVDASVLADVADELLDLGAAVVGLKLGDQGLYLRTGDDAPARLANIHATLGDDAWRGRELITPCFAVDVVGTTGSGDATIAGFLAALLRGEPAEAAITAAVAVGACNVEAADSTSGVRPWNETAARLAGGWKRHELRVATPDWRPTDCDGVLASPRDGTS
ncbi:MAG: carbohydrate kinase family protein [Planctomycetota bacterium]|nr:MAG: carbohydrate kinase family protein [Planctomycetota bacterium]REJ96569.1 MAG: carbohydrate kinase family protein [Planctomycetota bacterium]REK21747.1 MAG: carbohydrate kinase family protein [Planctomycetota bacterium]REK43153.1 MAG: carbohydrate kinase family protein [Planctomycetota bacterium]